MVPAHEGLGAACSCCPPTPPVLEGNQKKRLMSVDVLKRSSWLLDQFTTFVLMVMWSHLIFFGRFAPFIIELPLGDAHDVEDQTAGQVNNSSRRAGQSCEDARAAICSFNHGKCSFFPWHGSESRPSAPLISVIPMKSLRLLKGLHFYEHRDWVFFFLCEAFF